MAHIAQCLASDEARHATSFMAYARRQLTRTNDPDGERRAALKALWMWLGAGDAVQHPVNQMVQRVGAREDIADVLATLTVGVDAGIRDAPREHEPTDAREAWPHLCVRIDHDHTRAVAVARDVRVPTPVEAQRVLEQRLVRRAPVLVSSPEVVAHDVPLAGALGLVDDAVTVRCPI